MIGLVWQVTAQFEGACLALPGMTANHDGRPPDEPTLRGNLGDVGKFPLWKNCGHLAKAFWSKLRGYKEL